MALLQKVFNVVDRLLPARVAYGHCDIPCGIYGPIIAKIAAQTVQKMVLRIQALERPASDDSGAAAAYANTLTRYIVVKEEHAQLCKKELSILWGDYFRPDHLEAYPDLHDNFWKAAKLCGANKQKADLDSAKELVATVDNIAKIFWATKNTEWEDQVSDVRFGA